MHRVAVLDHPASKVFRLLLIVLTCGVAGWQLLPWLTVEPRELIATGHLKDDAFFYSTLAERVIVDGFFSLDGVTPTNGFQPLWMSVLVTLKALMPGVSGLTFVRGFSWLFYLSGCACTLWLATRRASRFEALVRVVLVAGLVLLNRRFQDMVVEGLEVPLAMTVLMGALCLLPWFRQSLTSTESRPRKHVLVAIGLGLLGALVFFARTDLFWVAGLLWLWMLPHIQGRVHLALVMGMSTAAAVIPYLLHNLWTQDSFIPVSGRVKVFFMERFLDARGRSYWSSDEWHGPFSLFQSWLPVGDIKQAALVVLAGLALSTWLLWVDRKQRRLPEGIGILGVLAILHLSYMVLAYGEVRSYTNYYFVPEVLAVVLVLACSLSQMSHRLGVSAVALYILTTSAGGWGALDMTPRPFWVDRMAAADRLGELAKGDRVGAFWPGVFAELSEADVTPLDGVIGSNAYFDEVLKTEGEVAFMRTEGIRYVVMAANGKKLLGARRVRAPLWSDLGRERIWADRDAFRVVFQRGAWTILELTNRDG